jgi:uncharacterized protein YegL
MQNLVQTIYQLIVFIIDASPSMGTPADPTFKPPIEDLIAALKQLYADIARITHCAVEVMVISFADDVKVESAFEPAQSAVPPSFVTRGSSTNLGGGISKALDEVLAHRDYLRQTGLEVKQPWLVCITDAQPNMCTAPGFDARLVDLINRGKCVFLPVAVGGYTSYDVLDRLSPKQKPIVVASSNAAGMGFSEYFKFLSQSMASGQLPSAANLQQNHE